MGEIASGAIAAPTALAATHDVSTFDCGKPALSDWLKQRALKAEGRSARTYVIAQANTVIGYYSLSTGSVGHDGLNAKMRQNMPDPVPVLVLARLALDLAHQRKGVGQSLLRDALLRCLEVSGVVGAAAVLVHAIDDEAAAFYLQYGFKEFPAGSRTLFLPMSVLREGL